VAGGALSNRGTWHNSGVYIRKTTDICQQADLENDPKLKDRLISLTRIDGHARWVSPAVLRLMPNLPEEVDGGLIVRDKQGKPTGLPQFFFSMGQSASLISGF